MEENGAYYSKPSLARRDRNRLFEAFEKMLGKEYWQKGLTEQQRQRYLADPESAKRVAEQLSKEKEQEDIDRQGAYRKAKYGQGSQEYRNFLAMQKATYDPRKG